MRKRDIKPTWDPPHFLPSQDLVSWNKQNKNKKPELNGIFCIPEQCFAFVCCCTRVWGDVSCATLKQIKCTKKMFNGTWEPGLR